MADFVQPGQGTATSLPSRRASTAYPGIYVRNTPAGRRYEIDYTGSDGKRRRETVPGGLRDAQRARSKVLERMHKGEQVAPSKLTVKELAEDYLKTQTSHLRPSTLKTYEGSIDAHIIPKLGMIRVSNLDVNRLASFIADMRDTHAAWTIHGTLTPLSAMMNYAVRRGWASSNPVKSLTKHERPRDFNKPMRILSTEEIAALLRASTATYLTLLLTAIFSGLRIGELLRLRWTDVDFEHGLLTVRESKTSAGIRDVVVPQFVVQELAQASLRGGEFVFETQEGNQMKTRTVARRALEVTLKRAGLEHMRFHDLRHTYASLLIGQGEDVTFVAAQMGHASPAITLNVYAKLFDVKRRRTEARDRLQANFAGIV